MRLLEAFFVALSLLTRVRIPRAFLPIEWSRDLQSQSLIFYPAVGLLIGFALVLISYILPTNLNTSVSTILLLIFWVGITGALHLDGLADCIDAYFASHKDALITLKVLRDPHVGAMSVIGINVFLLFKFCLVYSLLVIENGSLSLLVAPVLARLIAVFYMAYTPYVRQDGIASDIDAGRYLNMTFAVAFIMAMLIFLFSSFGFVFFLFLALFCYAYFWRSYWLTKIQGYTGDCVGALIEQSETVVLFVFLISLS